jgi:hypothetical protein
LLGNYEKNRSVVENKNKNVLSTCFELRRNLMRGELNFPSGVNSQSVIKWLSTPLLHTTSSFFLFLLLLSHFSCGLMALSTSKGEIDILLNPHNLLIKIIISFLGKRKEGAGVRV